MEHKTRNSLPGIVLEDAEHASLMSLASEAENRLPGVGEALLAELDRASIVAAGELPPNVVRMGSTVLYRYDDGHERTVTLVFPAKADIAEGRISVMTPIGAALIGLSKDQSIKWTARDGKTHRLTVIRVEQDEAPDNVAYLHRRERSAPPNIGDDDHPGPRAA